MALDLQVLHGSLVKTRYGVTVLEFQGKWKVEGLQVGKKLIFFEKLCTPHFTSGYFI